MVGLIGAAGVLTALVPGSMLLVSSATIFAKNIYQPIAAPDADDRRIAIVARSAVPAIALLSVWLTLRGGEAIVPLLLMGYSLVTQLMPALLLSLGPGRAPAPRAFAGNRRWRNRRGLCDDKRTDADGTHAVGTAGHQGPPRRHRGPARERRGARRRVDIRNAATDCRRTESFYGLDAATAAAIFSASYAFTIPPVVDKVPNGILSPFEPGFATSWSGYRSTELRRMRFTSNALLSSG